MIEHHTQFNTYIDRMADKVDGAFLKRMKEFQSNTLKPISTELIDEWKKVLTEDEIAVSEKINEKLDITYGYLKVSKSYSYTLTDRINILKAIFEKKVYHKLYIESPLWLKMMVKKENNMLWFSLYDHKEYKSNDKPFVDMSAYKGINDLQNSWEHIFNEFKNYSHVNK
jgi:hypothetical protein